MDMDLFKSAPDDHMDLMMMEMNKLSDFIQPYDDVSEIPTMEFSSGGSNNSTTSPSCFPQIASLSPTFKTLKSTISFNNPSIVHDQNHSLVPLLCNSSIGRSRNVNVELENLKGNYPYAFPTDSQKRNSMSAMREMIFRIASLQPIHIDPESVKPPKRRNVKISKDPQSVAARHRRERISEKIRILQRLVPGGTKMDTASMLDEAIHYVKFLKNQVQSLERAGGNNNKTTGFGFPVPICSGGYFPMAKHY